MSIRPVGVVGLQTVAAAGAVTQIELDPAVGITIQVTEIGISHNGAPNDTSQAPEYHVRRNSAAGTGGIAFTVVKGQSDIGTAIQTVAKVGTTVFTVDGTLVEVIRRWFVPIVSGMIWVAAPGREYDCLPAQFFTIRLNTALPASRNGDIDLIFEE